MERLAWQLSVGFLENKTGQQNGKTLVFCEARLVDMPLPRASARYRQLGTAILKPFTSWVDTEEC